MSDAFFWANGALLYASHGSGNIYSHFSGGSIYCLLFSWPDSSELRYPMSTFLALVGQVDKAYHVEGGYSLCSTIISA